MIQQSSKETNSNEIDIVSIDAMLVVVIELERTGEWLCLVHLSDICKHCFVIDFVLQ
jgi:hypothetical protein